MIDAPLGVPREIDRRLKPVKTLSVAAMALVGVVVVLDVVAAAADWRNYLAVQASASGADINAAVAFDSRVTILELVAMVATAVVFLVWLLRARNNAELISGFDTQRHSKGWLFGSWICPVVNFWFPYQVVVDVWRASAPRRPVSGGLVLTWWLLYLGSGLTSAVATRIPSLLATAELNTLSSACYLACGAVLALIITRVTVWQSQPR